MTECIDDKENSSIYGVFENFIFLSDERHIASTVNITYAKMMKDFSNECF
jgi:hypothetical protein